MEPKASQHIGTGGRKATIPRNDGGRPKAGALARQLNPRGLVGALRTALGGTPSTRTPPRQRPSSISFGGGADTRGGGEGYIAHYAEHRLSSAPDLSGAAKDPLFRFMVTNVGMPHRLHVANRS
jgi:hypothetical protein